MERLQEPMGKLQSMEAVLELASFKAAQHSYESLMADMQQYEQALVGDWCGQVSNGISSTILISNSLHRHACIRCCAYVPAAMLDAVPGSCNQVQACCWFCLQVASTSDEKLNQPLLQFHEESTADMPLLAVNFDPALVRLLRETRYFLLLRIEVSLAAGVQYAGTGMRMLLVQSMNVQNTMLMC